MCLDDLRTYSECCKGTHGMLMKDMNANTCLVHFAHLEPSFHGSPQGHPHDASREGHL